MANIPEGADHETTVAALGIVGNALMNSFSFGEKLNEFIANFNRSSNGDLEALVVDVTDAMSSYRNGSQWKV